MQPRLVLTALAFALVVACGGPAVGATPSSPAPALPTNSATSDATPTMPAGEPTEPPTAIDPATPAPTLPHVPPLQPPAYASRIVVSDLNIDLPVVSGDLQPPPSYPFCDVAAWVTLFGQPYEQGITYITAHAQRGMFLPLLHASEVNDGQRMLGMSVSVYTNDGRRFDYEISQVLRHRTDYSLVDTIPLDEQTLIMQTSEGLYGTLEKVQVVANLVDEATVDLAEANPEPHPRLCDPGRSPQPSASPTP
jgi:hypothetical protein